MQDVDGDVAVLAGTATGASCRFLRSPKGNPARDPLRGPNRGVKGWSGHPAGSCGDLIYNSRLIEVQNQNCQGDNMPRISVEVDEGKTTEQKRGLVRDLTEATVKNLKVPLESVTVVIFENKKENRARAGKLGIDS